MRVSSRQQQLRSRDPQLPLGPFAHIPPGVGVKRPRIDRDQCRTPAVVFYHDRAHVQRIEHSEKLPAGSPGSGVTSSFAAPTLTLPRVGWACATDPPRASAAAMTVAKKPISLTFRSDALRLPNLSRQPIAIDCKRKQLWR